MVASSFKGSRGRSDFASVCIIILGILDVSQLAVNSFEYDVQEGSDFYREKLLGRYRREAQSTFPGSQSPFRTLTSPPHQFPDFGATPRIGPRFSSEIYEVRIWEGSERGSSIGDVLASSPSGDNIQYFLPSNDSAPFLTVDRSTGKLNLVSEPKNIKEGNYRFRVIASSPNGGNATAIVKVRVSYSNRHRPVFTNCNKTATVQEQDNSRPFVFQIMATDEDLGINGQEGLKYSIIKVPGSGLTSFRIDEDTGKIYANRAFDRDEPENERKLTIPIRVVDGGTPPLDNVCILHVDVEDVNDNEPLFDRAEYEATVPKDTPKGSEVLAVSATDIDDHENAIINFSLEPDPFAIDDAEFFRIDGSVGQIYLKKSLETVREGTKLKLIARAQDMGKPPKSTTVKITVIVVQPALNPPVWVGNDTVHVKETFSNFDAPIANFTVHARSEQGQLYMEILRGQSENTNSKPTFNIRVDNNNIVYLLLTSPLDYERITSYDLTITALDTSTRLRAEKNLRLYVDPMNDNIPIFGEIKELVVLENEPEGTLVGTVVAEDKDAWDEHNRVVYSFRNPNDPEAEVFTIIADTGEVKTKKSLDREKNKTYVLDIMASDNYPSAIKTDGSPNNSTTQVLVIVKDVNDNPPVFEKNEYEAEVLETMVNRSLVLKVKANDPDESSELIYSIISGNQDGKFSINERTGEIRIANDLDFEKTQRYTLNVGVSDLKFSATAVVRIAVKNVADEPPKFQSSEYHVTISENSTYLPQELIQVKAIDPEGAASVGYFLQAGDEDTYRVESDGQLLLLRALDRDEPHGKETWSVRVWAHTGDRKDELVSYTTVYITLTDINDNPPYLVQIDPPPLVWEDSCERCPVPGGCQYVAILEAKDNDGPDNGAPFTFALDTNANPDIGRLFRIEHESNGKWVLYNQTTFDREKQKEYRVPIIVTDSPRSGQPLSATSYLKVVIGDCNDNDMFDGYSEIFVMDYKGQLPQTKIGRVFVEDLDDWDLGDKTFQWESIQNPNFELDTSNGDILLIPGYTDYNHLLRFKVTDHKWGKTVSAEVNVTIQYIPEEAATEFKSASLRLKNIDQTTFIDSTKEGWSRVAQLKKFIGGIVGYPPANVDVLSVRTVSNDVFSPKTDVRFAVHGSPYLAAAYLNWKMTSNQDDLKHALRLPNEAGIEMFGVSECMEESVCDASCMTIVKATTRGHLVGSNRTTLLAVDTWSEPHCSCVPPVDSVITNDPCSNNPCKNGGTCVTLANSVNGYECHCLPDYSGPECQLTELTFSGAGGYALLNPLPSCNYTSLSIGVLTDSKRAVLVYNGPVWPKSDKMRKDLFSLELRNGRPVLIMNYGDRTGYLDTKDDDAIVGDGKWHIVSVSWSPSKATISVDGRHVMEGYLPDARDFKILNLNTPLQLGGYVQENMDAIIGLYGWDPQGYSPATESGFKGCLSNLTINDKMVDFADAYLKDPDVSPHCRSGPNVAKLASFSVKPAFLYAIVTCAILFILVVLLVVFVRRRHYDASWEDGADEHSRDTLGTYSEEGGGEGDTATYDRSLLKVSLLDDDAGRRKKAPHEQQATDFAEIASFLDSHKRKADTGDEEEPKDDLRHYAYEGQGSSVGDLSSLSSEGTGEPVNDEFFTRLGPQFRRLADMYRGSESDSDDSFAEHDDGEGGLRRRVRDSAGPGPESWC